VPPVAKDLTELVEINPTRIDLVKKPANGFPVLVMKAVNASGQVNEKPDIAAAEKVLALLAKLIQAEADEMATGQWDEVCDIELLSNAAQMMMCFRRREQMGMERQSDSITKDLEGAIADRAGELGVTNPLSDHAAKDEPVSDTQTANPPVTTDTQTTTTDEPAEKSAVVDVEDAVAKAVKPLLETVEGLRAEVATLKATPIPGGPAVSAAAIQGATAKSVPANADADRFERLAKSTSDRELARYYADRAREARATA
jgi:hypothetical protein